MPATGQISAAERRFDQLRHRVGAYLAPAALIAVWLWPIGDPSDPARQMAAITVFTVILWVTEVVPLAIAALLGPSLAVLAGIAPAGPAFAPFAHPLIFLFIGGLLIAHALSIHGVDRRIALWIISRRIVGGRPRRALVAVCTTTFVLSMWLSNTATSAMMLPVVVGLCDSINDKLEAEERAKMRRFQEGMLIAMAYSASVGGMATPVGTAPNMIALGAFETHLGLQLDFLQWMSFGVPIAVLGLALVLLVAYLRYPAPETGGETMRQHVESQLHELGPMGGAEKRAIAVFIVAIVGWLTPALCRVFLGEDADITIWTRASLKEGVVAIVAASLLFIIPARPRNTAMDEDEGPKLLEWRHAVAIDWGTILLLGGGIALGKLIFDTGLATAIGHWAVGGGGPSSDPIVSGTALLLASSALVILMTEFTSNTATTNMMLPVLIPIALASGFDPIPIVLSVVLAASFAFMLPVSTPPNAVAYGSGRIRLPAMIGYGAWMDLFGFVLLAIFGTLVLPYFEF